MTIHHPDLPTTLLSRLRPFFARAGQEGFVEHSTQLFSYCAVHRERLKAIVLDKPLLGIVLRGAKEVWFAGQTHLLTRGTVFAFPRDVPLDIVNIPDDGSGIYESLGLPIGDLPVNIAPRPAPRQITRFDIALTPDLVEAIAHAATAVTDPRRGAALARLRVAELLMLLDSDPVGQMLLAGDLASRARWLIAARPDHDWTVAELARDLGQGASTLRRKLGQAGHSFRGLLTEVRMQAAHQAIGSGASVTEAATAAGYQSRSHFARAYRAQYGVLPRADRGV